MKILALECAAKAASAAILIDGKCAAECFTANGRTHSETLLPLVNAALTAAGLACQEMDAFAVAAGPGSFTGVRIGIAAVKGMALPLGKPCAGVSSLECAACNMLGRRGLVLPLMDARCSQVYTALFRVDGDHLERLLPDSALTISELAQLLAPYDEPIYCVGDGAGLLTGTPFIHPPEHLRLPRAFAVAQCAYRSQNYVSAGELLPVYLRVPQAERVLGAGKSVASQ
ncbi:MAG: tRNA (adenosine(37)-N6)-threonylcarbamoyltransferase complex dimerization subunit type 1 TsaB [Oscillospiraceae bacterium]|nr:tRNA (adenosine(37)-N6)-threonylcarbamoyltransferase complex dimerization subunit type 1 TsaB [Oscillospiraceae bacterium]